MSNMFGGDEVNALVLDVGTCTCKAGYAGDDAPKAVFPSHVGVVGGAKDINRMDVDGAAPQGRQLHIGQSGVNYRRDNMEVVSPFGTMEETVEDWDMVEGLWQHAFKERLRADPTEYAILMAESNSAPRAVREKTVELLFEKFKVPAVYLAKNAALSAFATARQTGLVVDAGYRSTTVTAVHDGFVLTKSVTNVPVGGKLLSHLTQRAMEAKAIKMLPRYMFKRKEIAPGEFKIEELAFPNTTPSFHAYQLEQLVTDIREAVCKVHETPFEETIHQHLPASIYELPDGTEISVGSDRLKIPEVYFQPQLLSTFTGFNTDILRKADGTQATVSSLPAAVLESVNKCDVDVRRDLYQGVVLTGGVSLTSGLRDRLEKELQDQGPQAGRFKVITAANAMERKFSVWIGGSILASLGSFQQMWMSKKEYEEHGAALIHRKAP